MIGKFLILLLLLTAMMIPACSTSTRLCKLSFDANCRICDIRSDGAKLLEYFNTDTNELRLFILEPQKETEISHPHGKVPNFRDRIDENQILFDRIDPRYLRVNGEKFEILEK
ncbi:hypothetical protein [Leptolyngbya sp. 7M]|uniref:hypothetical protein n=1 Tax=Leptolyngbya sp. 7M TaxID=2812896 RepID=UPI001B8CB49A|nr:hypothetical protein [Leptolyngbya sp. 7M]QYO65710.1 hypothetical protein JVX88_02660 [Leptolyngbya sp. 7M]